MPYITLFKEVNEFYILIDSILFISNTEHFSGLSKLRQKHYSCLYNLVCLCTNQTITQFTTKQVFGNQHTNKTNIDRVERKFGIVYNQPVLVFPVQNTQNGQDYQDIFRARMLKRSFVFMIHKFAVLRDKLTPGLKVKSASKCRLLGNQVVYKFLE